MENQFDLEGLKAALGDSKFNDDAWNAAFDEWTHKRRVARESLLGLPAHQMIVAQHADAVLVYDVSDNSTEIVGLPENARDHALGSIG